MQFPQAFIAAQVAPQTDYTVVPLNWYVMALCGDEMKASAKNPNSGVLVLEAMILDGQYKGTKVRWNNNMFNESPEAARIGQSQMSTLIRALGNNMEHTPIHNPQQLYNMPFMGKYGPQEDNQKYGELKDAKKMGDPSAVPGSVAPPAAPTAGMHPPSHMQQPAPPPSAFVPPVNQTTTGPYTQPPAQPNHPYGSPAHNHQQPPAPFAPAGIVNAGYAPPVPAPSTIPPASFPGAQPPANAYPSNPQQPNPQQPPWEPRR